MAFLYLLEIANFIVLYLACTKAFGTASTSITIPVEKRAGSLPMPNITLRWSGWPETGISVR
ncbi:MAG TPA: hypothetical protein GXX74_07540 [Clostridiales bacterium]|nr:hypothetical protein [Clostridiales bacterium]